MTREKLLKLLISHTTKTALCGAPLHSSGREGPHGEGIPKDKSEDESE
jgi:hypothetical protein